MAATTTITIVIDADIDRELDRRARLTGHTKTDIARDVLAEWLQDQDHYHDAVAARDEETSSSAEVRRRLGLED